VAGKRDFADPNWGNNYICGYSRYYSTNPKQNMRMQFEKNVGPMLKESGWRDTSISH